MYADLVIECDDCGRAFYGPGLQRVMHRVGTAVLCDECTGKLNRANDAAHGVASPRKRSARGTGKNVTTARRAR